MQCNLRISFSIILDGDKKDNKSGKDQFRKYISIGFSLKKKNYLFGWPGLSCGTRDLQSPLWYADSEL